jgi:hypothetical protein
LPRADDRTPTTERFSQRPPLPVMSVQEEERALNAAAAREVSRELDALHFDPPSQNPLNFTADSGPAPSPYNGPPPPPSYQLRDVSPMRPSGMEYLPQPRPQAPPSQLSISSSYANAQTTTSRSGPGSPITPPSPRFSIPPPAPQFQNQSAPALQPSSSPPAPYRSSPLTNSTSSLPSSPAPQGTRTIPAAAFKRPQPRVISGPAGSVPGLVETNPLLYGKRTLPSSPYPQRYNQGPAQGLPQERSEDGPVAQRQRSDSSPHRQPYRNNSATLADDDQFNYIAAYVRSGGTAESGSTGHDSDVDAPRGTGYEEGRFATDLEGQLR